MSGKLDVSLNDSGLFGAEATPLVLNRTEALITDGGGDLYRVLNGAVLIYVVPVRKGRIERRKKVAALPAGGMFPGYCYVNPAYETYKFLVVPKSEGTKLELVKNGCTEPLRRNFIQLAGIPKYQEEGFDRCLEEFYLAQSLKDEGFVVQTEAARKAVAGQTAATIISIAESDSQSAVRGSDTYRILAQACQAAGIELAPEQQLQACCGEALHVPDVARISNFTCREVVLQPKWYRNDCGVIIGSCQGKQVACYRKKGKRYVLYDGAKERPLTDALARTIEPKAYSVGRALPKTKLTGRQLFRFCKKSVPRRALTGVLLLGLAGTLIGILEPTLNQKIYDEYIALGDFDMVVQLCALIGSFMLGNVFFTVVKRLTEFTISCHVNYDLQNAVYWRIFQLPESFFRRYDSGDLAQRLSQAGANAGKLTTEIVGTGFSVIFSLFYLWRMIKYSGKLTLWAFLMTAVFTLLTLLLQMRSLRYEAREAEADGQAVSRLYQYLGGVDKIRMAGAEERAILEYLTPFTEVQRCNIREGRLTTLSECFRDVATYLFSMVLYLVIVKKNQSISIGSFMAFNSAFGVFSSSLMQLVGSVMTVYRMKPAYQRLKPVMDQIPEDSGQKQVIQSLDGNVEMEHVSFSYSQETGSVLHDVSFRVEPGEYVAVVGPSGCGKSTMLKLLLGFEQPTQGKVRYDGRDLQGLDAHSLRRRLGVVLQDGKLIAGSIYDNITITSSKATMKEVNAVIEAVGLKPDIDQMPMGIQTVLSESGNTISGGQQQRILIARAIMNHPQVLYFDEATSALDNLTQAKVCQSLDAMHVTRIVIAHRLSTVRNCDRILVMNNGVIEEEGNFEALMEKRGLFYRMAQRQLAEES